jgi:alpha-mannosidase
MHYSEWFNNRPPYINRLLLVGWFYLLIPRLYGQQQHIYLANDNHTDYFWSGNPQTYAQVAINEIDYYLQQADLTAGLAAPYQSRYNLDGAWYAYAYKQSQTAEKFERLVNRIRSGHISLPYNFLVSTYGGQPTEAILRGMYWPGRLERDYGLDLRLAVSMENQTLPLGLASLWAGSGAQYSWKGVCGCSSSVTAATLRTRKHELYRYRGLDGAEVVMKWYSLSPSGNQRLGGYAEARNPAAAIAECEAKSNTVAYPYSITGAFGHGWDDLQTLTDIFVQTARERSIGSRQIYVSNEQDFFTHFESQYGFGNLPAESETYGNDWDMDCEALAAVTTKVRRSVEKLRTAEALAAVVSLTNPAVYPAADAQREAAWVALGSYWEHNFGLGGCCNAERGAWQQSLERQISGYVDQHFETSLNALSKTIKNTAVYPRFLAFNPLGWSRTDFVDLDYDGEMTIKVVDLETGRETPHQMISENGSRRLRILAQNIPSAGYKVYEIQPVASSPLPKSIHFQNNVFENEFYRLTVTTEGVITSLVDKRNGNRKLVRETNGRFLNDFGQGSNEGGTITLLSNGTVSATIACTSPNPLQHTTYITLHAEIDRIDIDNQIQDTFGDEIRTYSYSFAFDNPTTWHEELGTILKAKYTTTGGHYAPPNQPIRHDWQTLNHFVDVGTFDHGIILSNQGAGFMKLGASSLNFLDENASQINVLIGGRMRGSGPGFANQLGMTNFNHSFALRSRTGAFDAAKAMKFALEHQNRLVGKMIGRQDGPLPENSFSLVSMSSTDVILWALKPAEEGVQDGGLILRMWNLDDRSQNNTATFAGKVRNAQKTTHLETDMVPATVVQGNLSVTLGQRKIETFRVFLDQLTGVQDGEHVPRPELPIRIFPNPTSREMTVEVPAEVGRVTLKIYNAKGHELLSNQLESGSTLIDLQAFPTGVLFLVFENRKGKTTRKVVKR